MSILVQIKTDQINARKAKLVLQSKYLTTLLSEAQRPGLDDGKRQSTDNEVVSVCKKFIKAIDETLKIVDLSSDKLEELLTEKALIVKYLPIQISDTEMCVIINDIIDGGITKMGLIMQQIKKQHNGQYNGGVVSGLVKKALLGNN